MALSLVPEPLLLALGSTTLFNVLPALVEVDFHIVGLDVKG